MSDKIPAYVYIPKKSLNIHQIECHMYKLQNLNCQLHCPNIWRLANRLPDQMSEKMLPKKGKFIWKKTISEMSVGGSNISQTIYLQRKTLVISCPSGQIFGTGGHHSHKPSQQRNHAPAYPMTKHNWKLPAISQILPHYIIKWYPQLQPCRTG